MPALIDVLLYDPPGAVPPSGAAPPPGAPVAPIAALSVPASAPLTMKHGRVVAAAAARCVRAPLRGRAVVYLLGEAVHEFVYDVGRDLGAASSWTQLNPTADPYVVQLRLAPADTGTPADALPYRGTLQLAVQITALSDRDRLRAI